MNKLISMEEAVQSVASGSMLALGGLLLYRRPMAFTRALLHRFVQTGEPKDLTLLAFTAGLESDLLLGAGMLQTVRTCYFGLEIFGLAPMFSAKAASGEIRIIEETEASLSFGLRASIASVGFMPGRGWIGTDMLTLRPDVHTVIDPYSGEELVAFPAIHPDTVVIHALCADQEGNVQIGGNKGADEELAVSAPHVIVTAEQIVPRLTSADIVAPFVDAVVLAPGGAAPTSCHPLYPLDGEAILGYTEQVGDQASFQPYLARLLEKETSEK